MTLTAVWNGKFNYIPSTKDGYTLQEGDELKRVLDRTRAHIDAAQLIENLYHEIDAGTLLDEFLEYARSAHESKAYMDAFIAEFEYLTEEMEEREEERSRLDDIYAMEEQRIRDYDDGVIWADDH